GIVSGFHAPKGLVGDLGGGSLELVSIDGDVLDDGVSVPLGALRLREESEGSLKKAREITVKTLEGISIPDLAGALPFFAVGGTWRAFATLDMAMRGYRLRVLHQYRMKAKHVVALAREITSGDIDDLPGIEEVSSQRRALLPYGAIVLEEVVKRTNAQAVSISALGVREGLLFDRLPEDVQVRDPLIEAARDLAILRSRSVDHAAELCDWTDRLVAAAGVDDEPEDVRLRHAACWLADIGWRAHPDYRGEQSLNIIANAALMGIDHPGRAFLALTVFFRYAGYEEEQPGPGLKNLVSERLMNKARAVGAMMRVAYRLSAAMPGTLPRISFAREQGTLILKVPTDMRDLHPERVSGRYQKLCQALGLEGEVRIGS
ncbi:MAG: exopolyphosphatase, partial [Pseudomonadota bacterium]